MDISKLFNIVNYILDALGEISKTKLMKLMFFIDFEHTKKYNRPITWSSYHRLPQGPVPSYLLDVINNTKFAAPEDVERFRNIVDIRNEKIGRNAATFLKAKKKPVMEEISESEKEVINSILEKYREMNAPQLIKEAHKHIAWKCKTDDKRVKYSDTFEDEGRKEYFKMWEEDFELIYDLN